MRSTSRAFSAILLCSILLASCGGVTPVPMATPTLTATLLPTAPHASSQISTTLPTIESTPTLSIAPIPVLSSETPVFGPENYRLSEWTPQKAEELIRLIQNYPETLSVIERGYHDYSYIEAFYFATWAEYEALLRFPNDPRTTRWQWWLGNDIAVSHQFTHDGQAGKYYAKLILDGLNSGQAHIQDLADWILGSNPKSRISLIRLENAPVGYVHNYVLQFESLYLWILESTNGFQVYPLVDDFYYDSYEYKVQDLTGDNFPEFIVSYFRETNFVSGVSDIYVFDLSHVPFQKLPFNSIQNDSLGWVGYDWSVGNSLDIHITDEYLLFCPIYQIEDYWWNGKWFELNRTHFDFAPQKANDLKYCDQLSLESTFLFAKPNEVIPLFETLTPYWPISDMYLKPPADAKDEIRFRLGVLYALANEQSKAIEYFTDIIKSPSISSSSWIESSKKFLGTYTSPNQIYRACSTTLACNPKFAIDQLVMNLTSNDYYEAIETLKSLGVPILASSLFDFDGDGSPELWFTIRHSHMSDIEFWILSHSATGLSAQYVNKVLVATPQISVFQNGANNLLLQIDKNKLYAFYHSNNKGLIFSENSITGKTPPDILTRRTFDDIRYALYDGQSPTQVRDSLLVLRKNPSFICNPAVNDDNSFEYRTWPYINYCQDYFYTLGLAYELSGDITNAIQIYWNLWHNFPDSPFSLMAQYKLELVEP